MKVADITKKVKDLDKRKLRSVRNYEEKNAARKGVLTAIDKKLNA